MSTDLIGTHGHGCESWGPAHYECALREIERLRAVPARGALTDLQVSLLWDEMTPDWPRGIGLRDFRRLVAAVEHAHGIAASVSPPQPPGGAA